MSDDRKQYVAESAEYINQLATRSLYSDDQTAAALERLERTERRLESALEPALELIYQSTSSLNGGPRGERLPARTALTGLPPALPDLLHSQIVRALLITQQGIADLKAYRDQVKPDRNRLKRSAVNLAAAYFPRPTPKPVGILAAEILAAAGEDNQIPERTLKDWLAKFKKGNSSA